MNNSNFTGRTSRTMNEAFGAHCNTEISERKLALSLFTAGDIAVMFVCMVAGVVLVVVI